MNLEEFRSELDTDAQKKCLAQEQTIHELNEQKKDMVKTIESRNKLIKQLQNRCIALTHGTICLFCGIKDECESRIF